MYKKDQAHKRTIYREILLLVTAIKVYEMILERRLRRIIEKLRMTLIMPLHPEKALMLNNKLLLCFVDLEEVFDCAQSESETLKSRNVEHKPL